MREKIVSGSLFPIASARISNREHRWDRAWQREGHQVIECKVCGYRHLYPLPAEYELEAFYKEYYHQEKQYIDYQTVDDSYISKEISAMQANREFRHIYAKVETLVLDKVPSTMIDIGGGNNLLSRFFMDRGWEATVFEPNCDAANYQRQFQISVVESMFGHAECSQKRSYAFINLQFVLEHVLNPLNMLCQSVGMLDADGIIRVCVPNDFSPGQMAWLSKTKLEPPWISYPDHINYFDFDSLSRLLASAGLVEVSRETSFPLEFLLLTGTDYYTDKNQQKQVASIVTGFETAWLNSGQEKYLGFLYETLAQLGMGRSAIIYARKKTASDNCHT